MDKVSWEGKGQKKKKEEQIKRNEKNKKQSKLSWEGKGQKKIKKNK
jgi:hypothetical protein